MKNPVDDAKNQRSNKISPYAADSNRHIGKMYTIHDFDGQPKDDDVDDKTEQPGRKNDDRKRKQLHERFYESIKNADNNAPNDKKHKSSRILKVSDHFRDGKKRQTVENNAEKNFFKHKIF